MKHYLKIIIYENIILSRFVFYLNRHIPTNLSKLPISGGLHAFK